MATKTRVSSTTFNLKAPVLSVGRDDQVLSRTQDLSLRLKVYAEGGENAMHYHADEDHAFIVLQGEATFHLDTDDNTRVVSQWSGIMIPKGARYFFTSTGEVNLVLLRAGSPGVRGDNTRRAPDGGELAGHDPRNKHIDGVPVAGKFFGFQG